MSRPKGSRNNTLATSANGLITLSSDSNSYYRLRISQKITGKHKIFSLGIKADKKYLKDAVDKINEVESYIEKDIATNNLDMTFEKYNPKKVIYETSNKTFGYYLDNLEEVYFSKRINDEQSITTFIQMSKRLNRAFKQFTNEKLTIDNVIVLLNSIPPSNKRTDIVWDLKVVVDSYPELKKSFGIANFEFKDYTIPRNRKKRYIPSDEEIIDGFIDISINWNIQKTPYASVGESWAWCYGMIATYGLRPIEVYSLDIEASFNDERNSIYLNHDIHPLKTRKSRYVVPLFPEWVELFNLKDVKNPDRKEILLSRLKASPPRITKNKDHCFSHALDQKFSNTMSINFAPYNLRHAYAIRAFRIGMPMQETCKFMGHTLKEHEKTYQKYMPVSVNFEAYDNSWKRYKEIKYLRNNLFSFEELQAEYNNMLIENEFLKQEIFDLSREIQYFTIN